MQAGPQVHRPCLYLSCHGMCRGLAPGTSARCCSRHGEGERCGQGPCGARLPPAVGGWLQPALPTEGLQDRHGPGLIPCSPSPSRRGSRAHPLGSGCPPPASSAEGSAGVGFGCPGPACPQGLASRLADPLWGRAGSLDSASEGFPPGWRRRTCASRATSQPGLQLAGMPHCLSCRQLPARFIVTRRALGGCRPPSPSLGVTVGHRGVSVPCLAPSWAGSCHESQRIPAEMLQFQDPSSQPKTPACPHTHSCRCAVRQKVSSCWDWGGWTGLTQPGPCRCPHGAGQCRCQG